MSEQQYYSEDEYNSSLLEEEVEDIDEDYVNNVMYDILKYYSNIAPELAYVRPSDLTSSFKNHNLVNDRTIEFFISTNGDIYCDIAYDIMIFLEKELDKKFDANFTYVDLTHTKIYYRILLTVSKYYCV
jgi:hypothetical protein